MTWRGTTDFKDRFFAALVYVIPLIAALPFGDFLINQFEFFKLLIIPLIPFIAIYSISPFASLIIFFVLFLAVVRNERVSHFIRFNTMQAILVDILIFLVGFIPQLLSQSLGDSLLLRTLYNVVFLGTLAACFYSIGQSALGRYAEIPTISEAAYSQVR
jgi:hypothetical protein